MSKAQDLASALSPELFDYVEVTDNGVVKASARDRRDKDGKRLWVMTSPDEKWNDKEIEMLAKIMERDMRDCIKRYCDG